MVKQRSWVVAMGNYVLGYGSVPYPALLEHLDANDRGPNGVYNRNSIL